MSQASDDYDISTIEGTSIAIREWTGNSKRTHELEADLTYQKPYNVNKLGLVTGQLDKSITEANSTITSLQFEKITVAAQYEAQIAGVSNPDPKEKQNQINSLRSSKSSALSSIDSDISTQETFISDTKDVLATIDNLVDTTTNKKKIDNPEDLLAPYDAETAINEYYSNNSSLK